MAHRISRYVFILCATFVLTTPIAAEDRTEPPAITLSAANRAIVMESLSAVRALGADYFPFWDEAPLDLLLVTETAEFHIADWQPEHLNPLDLRISGRSVAWRQRQFAPNLLATFPVFTGERPTIVMGAPDTSDRTNAQWMATVIHEHVHQVQMSRPNYSELTAALDLAEDGDNGMWMINFPFPYDDEKVNSAFDRMAKALVNAANGILARASNMDARVEAYVTAKRAFMDRVGERNARYFEFQLWQEGIARYLEYRGARQLAALGATSLDRVASDLYQGAMNSLRSPGTLAKVDRAAVYMLGLLEGVVLEAIQPSWEGDYFAGPLATTPIFEAAL